MIFSLNKNIKIIKKNIEISLIFLLLIITVISTTLYNSYKKLINENYKDVINNIYFQKSVNEIFNNLTPRYKNINHRVAVGETFDKILNSYLVPNNEIKKVKKNLVSEYNLNNLKTNLNIKFTIDQSNNKKITSFMLPISRTKKIQLTRNLETDLFEKKNNNYKLNKKKYFQRRKKFYRVFTKQQ